MAFILTYTSLQNAIQAYMERSDQAFVNNLPLIIMLGQRRVARDLKILQTKQLVTGNLQATNPVLAKPADWLNTLSLEIGAGSLGTTLQSLEIRTLEYLDNFNPNQSTGAPIYFCDYTFTSFKLAPIPDQNYPFTLTYSSLPPLIDETNTTNVITQLAPDILLYACLLEACSYLKNDERLQSWLQYYTQSKEALSSEDVSRLQTGFVSTSH